MKSRLPILLLLFFTATVTAEEIKGVDYCHNSNINQDWDKKITDFPKDPIILKLAGLRTGLCQMIDKKQITHEQGTDIWEDERQRSTVDRSNEETKQAPKYTL
jgi:hypothetical protein